MSSLMSGQRAEPFSDYKPSRNAYTNFLNPSGSGNARSDVKVIKFTPKVQTRKVSSSDELSHVLEAIAPILKGQSTEKSYQHLSAACHRLILPPHEKGQEIYARIEHELGVSVGQLARVWRGSILGRETGFIDRFISEWRAWEKRVELLSAVYVYLDRLYASGRVSSIRDLSIEAFRRGVWNQDIIRGKVRDDVLAWSAKEREKSDASESLRPAIIAITKYSKLLGTFDTISVPYVDNVDAYFSEAAETNIKEVENGTMSPTAYIEWVLSEVDKERERAKTCLDEAVASQAVKVVRLESGIKMSERIVRKALDEAMELSDADALRRLYRFTIDVKASPKLVSSMEAHIAERLTKVISDPANDSRMIEETLDLKRFADRSVAGLFEDDEDEILDDDGDDGNNEQSAWHDAEDDKIAAVRAEKHLAAGRQEQGLRRVDLEDAIRNGFRRGIGSRENAPAEWIAKHLDAVMRKGQGTGTEAEFNALLDEIIALIGFTPDKDVFKAFYSTQLAKRLLLNKSASDDMERNMTIKLQKEMGEEFTSGDIMMKDLQLSETLVRNYQTARAKNPEEYKDRGDLTANVLTESAWPAYPSLKAGWDFKLTPELQASIDAFTAWYSTQHRNRQLSWRPQLGTVTLSARFDSGKYEVGVSLFQAVVLLQFNDDNSLNVTTLQERTGIESKELVRVLQSLSMGRKGTRVLVKKPPGKEVSPTDNFLWNKTFNSDRIKFRINQIQQDMSAEESKTTNEQVAVDRVSVLEATMVRVMKGRKKLTLQLLFDAVVSDVSKRFPPDVKEMKKRVESLIERDYLVRDEDDRNLLHYVA